MAAQDLHLVTDWQLDAPVDAVWREIAAPESWPSWWRAVVKVETLAPGDPDGVGARRRITWRTALPYTLTFVVRTTRVEPLRLIEGRAEGELDGTGIWTFETSGGGTHLRYDWRVSVTKTWMRIAAPLLRPAFAWNHGKVMGWGETDLKRRLARG
ncbi:MAG: SRPBCC family protein [Pseudolabrys sp.]